MFHVCVVASGALGRAEGPARRSAPGTGFCWPGLLGRVLILVVFSMTIAVSASADAAELADAKAAGHVGEQLDGYLGTVDESAPDSVIKIVSETNAKRRSKYAGIAKKRGIKLQDVASLAGAKLTERAAPGEYVTDSAGKWHRKK